MALIGGRDTRDFVVWTGVDAGELARLSLQDGTTMQTVIGLLEGALGAVSAEINSDFLVGNFGYKSDNPVVSYRTGTAGAFEDRSEYTRPDPKRAELEGHMLPMRSHDLMLRWTWDYLRNAYSSQVEADIATVVDAARTLARKKFLARLLKRGDDTGAVLGLGTGGYSPGFATAAANTSVDFVPPEVAGKTFDSSHNHMTFAASSLTSATAVAMAATVREHGHSGVLDLIVSETDEVTVRGFTDFIKNGDPLLSQVSASVNLVNLGENYIGYLGDSRARVRVQPGYPANYFTMLKSYGVNNPRNPIRIRVGKGETSLRFLAFPEPNSGVSPANPLGTLMAWTEFGVGVFDRTAGATNRNNAAWADGTAS